MKYDVIYADPPWKFSCYSKKGEGRSAANHYPTLDLEALKALPVESISADNSCLFLWGCNSMLPEALELMEAWGFEYKTVAFTWVKTNKKKTDTLFFGLGFHTRQNSEFCLLGTRGKPTRVSKSVSSVIWEHEEIPTESIVRPIMEHSSKPPEIRDRIQELMGDELNYIELFARSRKLQDGIWTNIGNEVEGDMGDIRESLDMLIKGGIEYVRNRTKL